eukprot:1791644-Pyramimonas_sp.AAC.1
MKAMSNVAPPDGEEKRRTTKAMGSVAPPGGRKRPGAVVQSTSREQPARGSARNRAARVRVDVGGVQGGNLTCT